MCLCVLARHAKVDTLPHGWNRNRVMTWVRTQLKRLGVVRQPAAVHLVSALNNAGLPKALENIHVGALVGAGRLLAFASSQPASPTSWPQDIRFKGGIQRDVFIVGAANVGKSSVVNQFINRPARSKAQRKDSDHQPQPKRRGKKQKHVSITLDELPPGYVREARLLLADTCSLVVATAAFRWEMFSLAVLTT